MAVIREPREIISRPIPVPDADSEPFWEACREQRLIVQRCTSCGHRRFPPIGLCHRCRSWEFEWVEESRGTVYSWVVIHHSPVESLRQELPYVVAVIDLGDGVRMPTQLVNIEPDAVEAGMAVEVTWQEIDGGLSLPFFSPSAG
jgi:uncharacterized OB-fold protein